jgi:hypothetical protein
MEKNSKKFIKWFLIYGAIFSILTPITEYIIFGKVAIVKNIIAGVIFGLVMSYFKTRYEKTKKGNK